MLAAHSDAVQDCALQAFKDRTVSKLAGVRCPHHQQRPRIKFHGSTLRDVNIQMSGCCAKLIDMANRAIALAS